MVFPTAVKVGTTGGKWWLIQYQQVAARHKQRVTSIQGVETKRLKLDFKFVSDVNRQSQGSLPTFVDPTPFQFIYIYIYIYVYSSGAAHHCEFHALQTLPRICLC